MAKTSRQQQQRGGDTSWFVHDRFGLFIHWGLYSMGARHEWLKHKEKLSNEQYDLYFKHFDPDLYDPKLWADAAANAGMKYFVITSGTASTPTTKPLTRRPSATCCGRWSRRSGRAGCGRASTIPCSTGTTRTT
jgi:hypothetical protein